MAFKLKLPKGYDPRTQKIVRSIKKGFCSIIDKSNLKVLREKRIKEYETKNQMKLTGKCKKEFEIWFENISQDHYRLIEWFESLDDNMKFGVYQDYGLSVSIPVFLDPVTILTGEKTITEARYEAIKKLNEIRNKKLKK